MFEKLNPNQDGLFIAAKAVKHFRSTDLHDDVLRAIWDLAEPKDSGYLDVGGFMVAMLLIGRSVFAPLSCCLIPFLVV